MAPKNLYLKHRKVFFVILFPRMETSPTNNKMKSLSRAVLVFYLLVLLWLVLFKFSYDISSVIRDYQVRRINLIPFASSSPSGVRQMIENIVVFVPFGLLLSVNFKQVTFWRKLALVLILSLAVEATQFVLAIGITDITDVITNTFGVLIGLVLYDLCTKHYDSDKLDRFIAVTVASILILFLLLRIFVFRVRY